LFPFLSRSLLICEICVICGFLFRGELPHHLSGDEGDEFVGADLQVGPHRLTHQADLESSAGLRPLGLAMCGFNVGYGRCQASPPHLSPYPMGCSKIGTPRGTLSTREGEIIRGNNSGVLRHDQMESGFSNPLLLESRTGESALLLPSPVEGEV